MHSAKEERKTMTKQSRNAPCPCGSGKKYKRCCLAQDEEARRQAARIVGTDLDDLSNSVLDLIEAGDLDAAENACRQLEKLYPNQVDGLTRMALVHKARGENPQAADCLRRAATFMQDRLEEFDPKFVQETFDDAEMLERI